MPATLNELKTRDFFDSSSEQIKDTAQTKQILRLRVGSHLYRTADALSDEDLVSVWVPTLEQRLGLSEIRQFKNIVKDPVTDRVVQEHNFFPLDTFIRLALKNNPSILEMFYVDPENTLFSNDGGLELKSSVRLFLARKKVFMSFMGYAGSQKQKLETKRERFQAFSDAKVFLENQEKENVLELKERLYVGEWKAFEKGTIVPFALKAVELELQKYGWRIELVQKYGFDCKFASQLLRLLSEAFDLFYHGELVFPSRIVSDLKDVREGKWTLKQVLESVNEWETRINEAYVKTTLPEESDYEKVNNLLVKLSGGYK